MTGFFFFPAVEPAVEYDGFADFPQYPINVLADINAILGILYHHSLPHSEGIPQLGLVGSW